MSHTDPQQEPLSPVVQETIREWHATLPERIAQATALFGDLDPRDLVEFAVDYEDEVSP